MFMSDLDMRLLMSASLCLDNMSLSYLLLSFLNRVTNVLVWKTELEGLKSFGPKPFVFVVITSKSCGDTNPLGNVDNAEWIQRSLRQNIVAEPG